MTAFDDIPSTAVLYLQPTGFCAPDYRDSDAWVQVAGLPVWARAMRVIARNYQDRVLDVTLPVRDLLSNTPKHWRESVQAQLEAICSQRGAWSLNSKDLRFTRPQLMGVLNATPDSFSDGGDNLDPLIAIEAGRAMIQAGADILDIGGESTRPGAKTVWEGDEIERVVPVITGLQGGPISIDTRKAGVMEAAIRAGAGIINDVSALTFEDESLAVAAKSGCPVVLMHAQGEPQSMQQDPSYDDVVLEVYDFLAERIAVCEQAGISRDRIAVDPGIGFGKTLQHNLALLNDLAIFHSLGCPLLLGVSRKRFLGALANVDDAKARMPGSLAAAQHGLERGVHILRAHDVPETRQMLDVWLGLRDHMQMPPK